MRFTIFTFAAVQMCFVVAAASTPPASTKPAQLAPKRLEGVVVHEPQSRPCGGATFVGAVVLKQLVPPPAPGVPGDGDVVVTLESSRPDIARVPQVVRIPPGEQAGRFEVSTERVAVGIAQFRIVARLSNERAESNSVTIRGPRITQIEGSPGANCTGEKATFTVRFDCPAPSSGLTLHLRGSGEAYGTEAVPVQGGNSASKKIGFGRCCRQNVNERCPWSVSAQLSAADGAATSGGVPPESGRCGQPDSCPN